MVSYYNYRRKSIKANPKQQLVQLPAVLKLKLSSLSKKKRNISKVINFLLNCFERNGDFSAIVYKKLSTRTVCESETSQ